MSVLLVTFALGVYFNDAANENTKHASLAGSLGPFYTTSDGDGIADAAAGLSTAVFLPNLGQVGHEVYFQLFDRAGMAHLHATSISILTRAQTQAGERRPEVKLRFIGANRRPEVRGSGSVAERPYLTDAASGHEVLTEMPFFSEVSYQSLYNGVDLRLKAAGPTVTRSFRFDPGTPVSTVMMHYDLGKTPVLLPSGNLWIEIEHDVLTYGPPKAYQIDGERQIPVHAAFKLGNYGALTFTVQDLDPSLPLVIEVAGV